MPDLIKLMLNLTVETLLLFYIYTLKSIYKKEPMKLGLPSVSVSKDTVRDEAGRDSNPLHPAYRQACYRLFYPTGTEVNQADQRLIYRL